MHRHRCAFCIYLGSTGVPEHRHVDFYRCEASVVGRYGHGDQDYWSMPSTLLVAAAHGGDPMAQALVRLLLTKGLSP